MRLERDLTVTEHMAVGPDVATIPQKEDIEYYYEWTIPRLVGYLPL